MTSGLTLLNLEAPTRSIQAAITAPQVSLGDIEQNADMFMSVETASGKHVTRERALRVAGVLACIRILSEDVSTLPLILKKKSPFGAVDAVDHPLYRLLKSAPNPLQTSLEVREHMVMDMLLDGKFFNYVPRNGAGEIQGIYPIPAATMTLQGQDRNGDVVWNCGYPGFKSSFTHHELWRGTMLSHNFVQGRPLMLLAREAIGLLMAAEEQGARLFKNGIQSDFILSSPEAMDQPTKDDLRATFRRKHAGSSHAWEPLIMSGGLTASRVGLTASESQYIEARHYQLADIARLARIPGVLLGLTDKSSTYASAEQFFQAYVKHTILPWATRFEQTADRDLILPTASVDKGLFVKHKLNELLRGDQTTRYTSYKTAIEGGFMQPAEARREEEWDEIPGLDVNWRPIAFGIAGPNDKNPMTLQAPPPPAKSGPGGPNPPKDTSTLAAKTDVSARLAGSIAASIVAAERRHFAKMKAKTKDSDAENANFSAWLTGKVVDLAGVSGPKATAYAEWRMANPDAETEATERLTNLCLEGEL